MGSALREDSGKTGESVWNETLTYEADIALRMVESSGPWIMAGMVADDFHEKSSRETLGEKDILIDMEHLEQLHFPEPEAAQNQRPTSPLSNFTTRRVLLAVSLVCICGLLPAMRIHGFFRRPLGTL